MRARKFRFAVMLLAGGMLMAGLTVMLRATPAEAAGCPECCPPMFPYCH